MKINQNQQLFNICCNQENAFVNQLKKKIQTCSFPAQKIHISPQTKQALDNFPKFVVKSRGEIPIKVSTNCNVLTV